MISPTVFVTGAGASAPYNFPTGNGLKFEVIKQLTQNDDDTVSLFRDLGFDQGQMQEFSQALKQSGRRSVDAFLEHRSEFLGIGKAAIARVLIGFEQPNTLFENRPLGWLEELYQHLNCPFERFGRNQVSFITFNYDRSLEHYLFTCLRNSYGKSEQKCADQLRHIQVIHLHGDLGALPWQPGDRKDVRAYDHTISPEAVSVAMRRNKIIHEDIGDRDREFNEARQLLRNAEQIYFLGFGYDLTNMRRLRVAEIPNGVARGTGSGLTPHERGEIVQRIHQKIQVVGHDCIDFLRNVVDWRRIEDA